MDTPNAPYAMEVSLKRYGVDRWGEEFLSVNELGHLVYRAPGLAPVDLHRVAELVIGLADRVVQRRQARRQRRRFEIAVDEDPRPPDLDGQPLDARLFHERFGAHLSFDSRKTAS